MQKIQDQGHGSSHHSLPGNDLELYAFTLLKDLEHIKEVIRARISLRAEHPVKALAWFAHCSGKLFKAHCSVNVVPKDRLPHFDISGKKGVDRLKNISPPSLDEFSGLIADIRKKARQAGIKRSDISNAIEKARGRKK